MNGNEDAVKWIESALSELNNSLYTRKSQEVKNQYQMNAVRYLEEALNLLKENAE